MCKLRQLRHSSLRAVAARIVSFSQELVTAWKQDVSLQCKRVGVPPPQSAWRLRGRTLETGGRKQVREPDIGVGSYEGHAPL